MTYRDVLVIVEPCDFRLGFSNHHHFIHQLLSCCGCGIIYKSKCSINKHIHLSHC